MAWQVYYNGSSVGNIREVLIDESLENPLTTFNVTVMNASADDFAFGHTISNRVEIYRNGVKKFDGFLEDVEPTERNLDIVLKGRSFEVLLLDERTSREDRYTNLTGYDVITSLLSKYSTKVIEGSITYSETLSGTIRYSHDNLLKGVAKACNIHNKDLWVEYDGTDFVLNVGERGVGSESTPDQTLYAGKHIRTTVNRKSARDIINRQRVFGSGDGINQIQACVPYIDIGIEDDDRSQGFNGTNTDCEHTCASDSQTTYGIMEGRPVKDKSIVDVDSAISRAKKILDKHCNPYKSLDVKFIRYVDISVGDWVRIIDEKKNIDETTRIKEIKHTFRIGQMDNIRVELFNPFDSTESEINIIKRDEDTENTHGLGATNIFQVQSYENCDTNNSLFVRFRLPDDIKTVNRVLLSFQVKPYRAYHQGVASDGSHSHTFSVKTYQAELSPLSGSVYLNGLRWDDFDNVMRIVSGDSVSSRSIMGETTTEETGHTHGINYGIVEQTLSDTTVDVYANGTSVAQFSNGTDDYDLTQYISATGSWHNVEFRPTNNNMRIEANLYIKCYIESN